MADSSDEVEEPSFSSGSVFINHAPDVKDKIASSLSATITDMRLTAIVGTDEQTNGDFLSQEMQAVINNALLHIAIFSEGYAKSPRCLQELSIMLKTGATVIPIFYRVNPTDLRYVASGKGIYSEAFDMHKEKGAYSLEQLEQWKNALSYVSFYTGQVIEKKEDERWLLKNIVKILVKVIDNVPLKVAKYPVGLSEIISDFEMNIFQSAQGNQTVEIVGIWGMGGSGKTTLAKELYNNRSLIVRKFLVLERSNFLSSFVSNVRDAATKSTLYEKQIKLLKDLGLEGVEFDNIEDGKAYLSRRLRSVKVFIVLDDVDDVDQLDALVPIKDSLCKGSFIIVTSREKTALKSWGISSIYKMKPLDPIHAEQLFCWHAFLKPIPLNGFEELVKDFLKACNGLPLSLKVFGAQLYGNSHEYWESQLNKISKILPTNIKERLRVSYEALDYEEKEAFLDVACFFIGEKNSLAIEVWYGSGWTGLHSWEMLVNKCLVDLDNDNWISMHDHLRDLGREISNQIEPYRMWLPRQRFNVEKEATTSYSVRGVIGAKCWPWIQDDGSSAEVGKPLPCLDDLKILAIKGNYFNQVIGEVSRELVWLRWFRFDLRNLRSLISIKKVRVLELFLSHHIEELWETGGDAPVELRELVVTGCRKLQRLPSSIGCLKHLKHMVITGPSNVDSLPEEFCHLQLLEHMELSSCEMLSLLPSRFGDLRKLRHLDLSSCERLSSLPDSFGGLGKLQHLDMSSCAMLSSLSSNFGDLRNLQHLDLSGCIELKMLPESFKHLILLQYLNLEGCEKLTLESEDFSDIRKLEILNLDGCKQLEELPRHIVHQALLKKLHLKYTNLMELPVKLGRLRSLQEMMIKTESLTSLPSSIGNLSSLTKLEMYDCPLEYLPSSVGDLNALSHLTIDGSFELECLPDTIGHLTLLEDLTMRYLGLKSLPNSFTQLHNLQMLHIDNCSIRELDFGVPSSPTGLLSNLKQIELFNTHVCRISISEVCCSRLEILRVCHNYHLTDIEVLPTTVKAIMLRDCKKLKKLPSFAWLTCLIEFELSDRTQVEKIEGIEHCISLETLRVDTCGNEPGIEGVEHMHKLRRLQLRANKGSAIEPCILKIKKWPEEIQMCAQAVPDAASLLKSTLPTKLLVIDSSRRKIFSRMSLLQKHCSNGEAFMLCFVVTCVSPQLTLYITSYSVSGYSYNYAMDMYKGKWIWIGMFKKGNEFREEGFEVDQLGQSEDANEVETCLLLTGEEDMLLQAFCSCLPLFLK